MKLSARFGQIFALLVITLVLLTTNLFASAKPPAKDYSAPASITHTRVSATNYGYERTNNRYRSTYGTFTPQNTFAFTEDGHALRPNPFKLAEPVRYAIGLCLKSRDLE